MRLPQLLTRRRLLLANLALGVLFVLAAFHAAWPLVSGRPQAWLAQVLEPPTQAPVAGDKPVAQPLLDEYACVIMGNDIFISKVADDKGPPPPPPPPPPNPRWSLAATWSPEGNVWETVISDTSSPRAPRELAARKGMRFRYGDCVILITQVTEDFVRFEIHSREHDHPFERILTWSGVVEAVGASENGR